MRRIRHTLRTVVLFLIIFMLVVPVYAADDLGLNVNGVTAKTENQKSGTLTTYGDGSWTNTDGVISGVATGKKGTLSSYTGTATLTFSIPKAGTFSFKYKDLSLNSGSLTIDGTSVTAAGTFEKDFAEAGTVTVVIKSAKGANTTKATIYDIDFITTGATNVTFKAVPGVDYTVNGVSVTEETGDQTVAISTETISVTTAYDNSGTIIREWRAGDGSAFSLEESDFPKPFEDIVLTPVLGPIGTPQYTVNGSRYYTWDDAFNGISDTTVTVTQSGTLPAGDYTIPDGVTLLIPFDTAGTLYTTTPADNNNVPWETPTAYRTLTMASGAHLTVEGAMSLSAKHHTGQALQNCGLTTGPYGHVNMGENSTITVSSGGVLYAWGYITGSGSVTVKSGAKSYEYFVIQDFKDGNSLADLSDNKDKRVFMTNNYYVQNIVVPMTIEAGSYLNGYSSCFFSTLKISKHAPISFIAPSGDNGLFKLSEGKITKRYDYATDRQVIDIYGTVEIGNISIAASTGLLDITINSEDYDMPIGSNITLTLKSGATMNLSTQSLVMIPGSELYIEEGASLNISSGQRFVLHDIDQWQKQYSYNARVHPLAFVPNRTYTFQDSDLKDPLMRVNGTVDASEGYLYVTAGGGIIYSTESGVVKLPAYSETTNSQYIRSSRTFDDYAITTAKLKNADGSYTETADATEAVTYEYVRVDNSDGEDVLGHWHKTFTVDDTRYRYFDIVATNVAVNDGLDLYFYVYDACLNEGAEYTATVTKDFADGYTVNDVRVESVFEDISSDDWEVYTDNSGIQYKRFKFSDISAKEMTDNITAVITLDTGSSPITDFTETIRNYAIRTINQTSTTDTLKTALIDMLNYGADAQTYFKYNRTNLANADITGGTTEVPTCNADLVAGENLKAVSVSAKNKLMLTFYFDFGDVNPNEAGYKATISYRDYKEDEQLQTVTTFYAPTTSSYFGVDVEGISMTNGRSVVTCTVTDASGTTVGSGAFSVESYAAKNDGDVYTSLIKFVYSACAYFEAVRNA